MSDEIDLHAYLGALRRRWWLLLGGMLAALAITFAFGAVQQKHYQAVATLIATSPRYQWRFDAGILPYIDNRRDYQREFLVIGRSNRIANLAAEQLQASGALPAATPDSLLAAVTLRTGDGASIQILATASTPEEAAAIANAWADSFVEVARDVTGVGAELQNYQSELALAGQRMEQAEQELAQVRSETGLFINSDSSEEQETANARSRQLALVNQRLAEYQTDLDALRLLSAEAAQVSDSDQLANLPWELLAGPVLAARGAVTPDLARSLLDQPDELLAALQAEDQALAGAVESLTAESNAVQTRLAADWQLYGVAQRQYNLARETYNTLSRKVDEASIQGRIDPSQLNIVSEALAPTVPMQTRRMAQLALAAVLGLLAGALLALWLGLRETPAREREPQAVAG